MIATSLEGLVLSQMRGRSAANPLPAIAESGLAARVVEVSETSRNPHFHPLSAELIYVLEGSGIHWQDGASRRVRAGELILVPESVPHVSLPDPDSTIRLLCVFPHPELSENIEELEGDVSYADLNPG